MVEPWRTYIPITKADKEYMLGVVNAPSVEALYQGVPQDVLKNTVLTLPEGMTEMELKAHYNLLASRNKVIGRPSFLGYGAYRHFIPGIVARIISRDEYRTAYTPYAPEIEQGTLQTTFDYQSEMCYLMKMDVSDTGMLDEATALAEAALMASRITGRKGIAALDTVHPHSRKVVDTYAKGLGLTVGTVSSDQEITLGEDTAALVVQYPNYLGYLEDIRRLTGLAHKNGSLMIVSVDNPTALGVLEAPGAFGTDIVVGNGQGLGLPLDGGGANVGIFTTKEEYVRQMPGRIVGKTTDTEGRTAYVLTLQTREQHIKREKATSNICTAEALMALANTIYLSYYGKEGFAKLARWNAKLAHDTAKEIASIPGFSLPVDRPFFNEFVVGCPKSPAEIIRTLSDRDHIFAGVDVSDKVPNGLLICVTEMNMEDEIGRLAEALATA